MKEAVWCADLLENDFLVVVRGSVSGLMEAEVVAVASCSYVHVVGLEEAVHWSLACRYGLWSGLQVWAVGEGGCRQDSVVGMADMYADNFGKEDEETLARYNSLLEMSFGMSMARIKISWRIFCVRTPSSATKLRHDVHNLIQVFKLS
jgi:hypothetical protein